MKKIIFALVVVSITSGLFFVACQKSPKKEDTAQQKLLIAQDSLTQVKNDISLADQKKARISQEWQTLKDDAEDKINKNEIYIAKLKVNIEKTGKSIDSIYTKKIILLEQKNKAIKARIETYKTDTDNDWESFQREFNHDMDELGKALDDLTIDNKK